MEESSSVAVLLTRSSTDPPSSLGSLSQATSGAQADPSQTFQNQQATDSLIQVIEKLSKIVERRPQHRYTIGGNKRSVQLAPPKGREEGSVVGRTGGAGRGGVSPGKRMRRSCGECEKVGLDRSNVDGPPSLPVLSNSLGNVVVSSWVTEDVGGPTVDRGPIGTGTCYQCSLCPYLSQTLPLLKEHLKQHDELHTDLLLMCSQCHFTSQDQALLEAHVQQHLDQGYHPELDLGFAKPDWDTAGGSAQLAEEEKKKKKKKWYSYEEYGLYRCLICSYVCSQQRMLKTHAWKHAGLVDCSYPIFEDEEDSEMRRIVPASSSAPVTGEKVVVLSSPSLRDKIPDQVPTAYSLQLFATPVKGDEEGENAKKAVPHTMKERQKLVVEQKEEGGQLYPVKHLNSEEPLLEVQVKTEEDCDLLSSAQKIIHSGPNSAGHINVIVERLPSAEDSLLTSNPLLLLGSDLEKEEALLLVEEKDTQQCLVKKEEGVMTDNSMSPPVSANQEPAADENIPPLVVGRKRTHSESLRLHSLAAEALVAMPMRTPEVAQLHGQRSPPLPAGPPQEAKALPVAALREEEEDGPATKGGISLSLLTVIERLRERSDQNTSDEDILKELRDNAQVQSGGGGGCTVEPSTVSGNRSGGLVCSISGVDTLVTSSSSSCSSLVDYLPGSERPYRCRLCRYSSDNKGYVKQHLRVHRQRQPYQCPICEHVSSDSQDLESHMIHHCKARSYQCKLCPHAFHYKVRGPLIIHTHLCGKRVVCFSFF